MIYAITVLVAVIVLIVYVVRLQRRPIKILFLDDERVPENVFWCEYPKPVLWTIVRTRDEFLEAIENNSYDIISFDHDLGPVEYTGYDLLKNLIEAHMDGYIDLPKEVYFHTQNPIGRNNMAAYWWSYMESIKTK